MDYFSKFMNSKHDLTVAEYVLTLAEKVTAGMDRIMILNPAECGGISADTICGRIKVALDFASRPVDFQFRAIMEGWGIPRLIREMY